MCHYIGIWPSVNPEGTCNLNIDKTRMKLNRLRGKIWNVKTSQYIKVNSTHFFTVIFYCVCKSSMYVSIAYIWWYIIYIKYILEHKQNAHNYGNRAQPLNRHKEVHCTLLCSPNTYKIYIIYTYIHIYIYIHTYIYI